MLLLSTHTGPRGCPVSVRVDDLLEEERALVRETLRLIQAMFYREDVARIMVAGALFLGGIGMIPIMLHYIPKASFMQSAAGVMAGAVVVGFMGWLIMRTIVNRRHESDAIWIRSHSAQSARCRDLVREYSAGNSWFAQAIKHRFEQVATTP